MIKNWLRSLSSLPWKTLQLHLLLYLLVVGSVPIVSAMLFYYQLSSQNARHEAETSVQRMHLQILGQLQKEFELIRQAADNIRRDAVAQSYFGWAEHSASASDPNAKAYINQLIQAQQQMLDGKITVCITGTESGLSICPDSRLLDAGAQGIILDNGYQFVPVDGQSGQSVSEVRYTASLTPREYAGKVLIIADLSNWLEQLQSLYPFQEIMLSDGESRILLDFGEGAHSTVPPHQPFTSGAADTLGGSVLSQENLQLDSAILHSQLTVHNQALSETRVSFRYVAAVFFVLLLALSIISSFVFANLVTRPLHGLSRLMKRAERGDLKAYWTANSMKEINELGNAYNQMLNRLEELIKQVKREEALKKEAEMAALQYQLNPHFLYNTLNTIKWVAKIHKTPQISDAVSSLVRLLQASLGKKGDFISLQEEIGLIHDYMEIQTFRYGESVRLEFDVKPETKVCLVPRMILQPLVENALIHGMDGMQAKDGVITVSAQLDRDMLICEVSDNGKGMSEEEIEKLDKNERNKLGAREKMSGIGLRHIRQKIKLYYGEDYKMLVFSKKNQGTLIRLFLPIHVSED